MSIKINTDNGTAEPFTLILSTRGHVHLGEIINAGGVIFRNRLNAAKELNFQVYKYADDKKERLWDDITDLKFVYVKELNTYFEMNVALDENDTDRKTVSAKSACECELSQRMLYDIEINTETDIARDDYVPTRFYNPADPKASLLDKILEKAPAYSIKFVEPSLMTMQRSFSVSDTSIYDFLTGECAEEFECIFLFDSVDRTISVYDLNTICDDCGYRGNYSDVCPECGSRNLRYFGDDTTILVSTENLTDEIQFETDTGSVKNCFKLEAGDDVMTAAVMTYIPSGDDKIIFVSEDQQKDMPAELTDRIKAYNKLYDSYTDRYHEVMEHIYECIERITYHTSKQMPDVSIPDQTAGTEASKLTNANLNPLSLSSLTSYTSLATVNSAVVNYAKVFVKSGFVKIEVESGSFRYNGKTNGINTGTWTGRLKVTNYSDKEDTAYSSSLTITVNDDYMSFMNEKILKNIADNNTDDGSVYDVLNIKSIDSFKDALKLYGLNRLISFRDAINGVLCILLEANGGTSDSELYSSFYSPYYEKLEACNSEINSRRNDIETWEKKKAGYEAQKDEIQDILDFRKFLGEELYSLFTAYIREDKYINSNYISDGLSDDAVFERAQEFLERARKELIKSSCYQHSIRADMYNLLLMEEFAPVTDHFELGNWIRVSIDDEIYRLRLVSYEINFDSLNTISTEFSDTTKTADGMNDINDILNRADSMASSYPAVSRQASDGHDADMVIEKLRAEGLDSALYKIKNADSEEITFGKNGLLARSYDDISETYSDKQLIITHNILAYTIDNWRSVKCALGEMKLTIDGKTTYEYGLNSDFCISSKIVAGNIYSADYSSSRTKGTRLCLDDGTFTLGDGKIVFDGKVLKIKGVEIDWSTTNESATMWASINANAEGIKLEASRAAGVEETLSGRIDVNADNIVLESTRAKDSEEKLSAKITLEAGNIRQEVKNADDALQSSITQTAKDIRSEVTSTKDALQSSITQTAEDIRAEVKKADDGLSSLITQNAGAITSEVKRAKDAESELSTKITQTEESIRAEVKNTKEALESSITQTAEEITADVSNVKKGLETKITTNADGLAAEIKRAKGAEGNLSEDITEVKATADGVYVDIHGKNGLITQIEAAAEGLSSKVSKNGIISAINQSAEKISINAGRIDLNGAVTANNYFKINTDGSMECDKATIKNATVTNAAITNGTIDNATCTNLDVQNGIIGGFVLTQTRLSDTTSYGYTRMNVASEDEAFGAGSGSSHYISIKHSGEIFTTDDIRSESSISARHEIKLCGVGGADYVISHISSGKGVTDWYASSSTTSGHVMAFNDALEVLATRDLALHSGSSNYIQLYSNAKYWGDLAAASSRRYKENIIEISEKDADAVLELVPVEFDYIETKRHSSGLIAEDAYKILPQIVGLKDGEPDNIDYIKLVPYLLKKMQMMDETIKELSRNLKSIS